MQFYASPEQIMRDRAEYARKNIARGRNAVVLSCADGVLFVTENVSTALHKVSEIYDRIGFAAVGRYNEFENLRRAGVRMADLNGYSYDRRDVTGRALANAYAQTLGAIFTDQTKPFEVEICVAEVGATPQADELFKITYDGTATDEPTGVLALGGQAEAVVSNIREHHRPDEPLGTALRLALRGLGSVGGDGGANRTVPTNQLEVAVLDRRRTGRTFRRITGAALAALLEQPGPAPAPAPEPAAPAEPAAAQPSAPAKPAAAQPAEPAAAQPSAPAKPAGEPPSGPAKPPAAKPSPADEPEDPGTAGPAG
jgi:proteasome alpha subunit